MITRPRISSHSSLLSLLIMSSIKNARRHSRLVLVLIYLLVLPELVRAQRETTLKPVQTFQAATTSLIRIDGIDETHVLYTYKDGPNSTTTDLKAVIGEVNLSTGAIAFGTPITIQAAAINHAHGVLVLSATTAVVAYELTTGIGGAGDGKMVVLTLATGSNSITNVGAATSLGADIDAASTHATFGLTKLSNSTFAVAYSEQSDGDKGKLHIGSVSGTTVTLGAAQTYANEDVQNLWVTALSSTKIALSYEADASSDHGKAIIGEISGTSVSFGTEATFNSAATSYTAAQAVSSSQFAVIYTDDDLSNDFVHSKVGTVSGTTITFGPEVSVETTQDGRDLSIDYLVGSEFVLAYNGGFDDNSKTRVGEVSGTGATATISYNTADAFFATEGDDSWVTSLGTDNFVIGFIDDQSATPDDARAIVGSLPSLAPSSASVAATVFLEGAYNGANLHTSLNTSIPAAQPYSGSAFNSHAGTESAAAPANAVDWVLVELREAASAATALKATKVGSAAGFLMSDGTIKATDGTSDLTVSLSGNTGSEFFVVIYHRNHLPIMSANAIAESSSKYTIDFTSASANTYQTTTALVALSGSKFGMPAGDADGDGDVDATDLTTWQGQNGITFVYNTTNGDFNLDGVVNAVDRNDFQQKNVSKSSQVPGT